MLLQLLLLPIIALALPVTNTTDPSDTTTQISTNILLSQSKAVVTSKAGLAFYNANLNSGNAGYANPSTTYNCYSGPASNFPAMKQWMSFNNMWKLMQRDALTPIGDTVTEQAMMLKAIKQVSKQAKVDARVILAVIIGEVRLRPRMHTSISTNRTTNIPSVYRQRPCRMHKQRCSKLCK